MLHLKRNKPWNDARERGLKLYPEMTEAVSAETEIDRKREIVRETMEIRGKDAEMEIYTDGSVEEGMLKGGSAAVIYQDGVQEVIQRAGAALTCSFRTEIQALRLAVNGIIERTPTSAIVYTDSQSAVKALESGRITTDLEVEELKRELWEASDKTEVSIQWIPAHIGIPGNEVADAMALTAREMNREDRPVDMGTMKCMIQRKNGMPKPQDARIKRVYERKIRRMERSTRREQVVMAQLRTGHCSRTAYYRKRIGLDETGECEDCGETEEKDHIFVCPRWRGVREELNFRGVESCANENLTMEYLRKVRTNWVGE